MSSQLSYVTLLVMLVTSQCCLANTTTTTPSVPDMNQGLVSREQFEMTRLIVELILKPVVCITGIVLNSIGIYVLLKPSLRHGFYIYLLALSMTDVGYLVFGLLRSSVEIYALYDHDGAVRIQSTVIPYTDRYLEICLCKLGAFCIMFFSLDRLMAIFRPLHARDNFLSIHSRGVCISLALFIFIIYIPKLINLNITISTDPTTNVSAVAVKPTHYEEGSTMKHLMSVYTIVLDVIFMYLPPVFVIAVNVAIIIQIRRLRSMRARIFSKDSSQKVKNIDQQKLIITVLIISGFFLGVYIPMIIVRNLTANNLDYRLFHKEHYMRKTIPIFVAFGWSINAAIDFTVYLGTSTHFRQTFKRSCCRANVSRKWRSSQSYPGLGKSQSSNTEVTTSVCSASTDGGSLMSTHMGTESPAGNVVEERRRQPGSPTSRKSLVYREAAEGTPVCNWRSSFIVSTGQY